MAGIPKQPPNSAVVGKDGQFKQDFARYWDAIARKAGSAIQNFGEFFTLTEDTAPDLDADYLLTYDVDASAPKRAAISKIITPVAATLIETVSASSGTSATSATIDFAALAAQGYRDLIVNASDISLSVADLAFVDFSDDDGSTWTPSSGVITGSGVRTDTATLSVLSQQNGISAIGPLTSAGNTADGDVTLSNFAQASTSIPKAFSGGSLESVATRHAIWSGHLRGLGAINKVRIRASSGNLDGSGSYQLIAV